MKRIFAAIVILASVGWFCSSAHGQIYLQADDHITIDSPAMDTLGYDAAPDSVTIYTYLNGVEMYDHTFTAADPQAAIVNTDQMVFHDQIQDIDGAGGSGFYCIKAKFTYTQGTRYPTAWQTLYVYIGGYSRFYATDELDSLMAMNERQSAALYVPCDSSFVREYPGGSKPKDSICIYCISGTLGVDTVKVATFVSYIHNSDASTTNVIDSLYFDMK